jgi:hypothetical protein
VLCIVVVQCQCAARSQLDKFAKVFASGHFNFSGQSHVLEATNQLEKATRLHISNTPFKCYESDARDVSNGSVNVSDDDSWYQLSSNAGHRHTMSSPDCKTSFTQMGSCILRRLRPVDASPRSVFKTLSSAAAQCVAYIACAESFVHERTNVLHRLTTNVAPAKFATVLREATLEKMGYIRRDLQPALIANASSAIPTAVAYGTKKEEPSDQVRLAPTNALLNPLELTLTNSESEISRNFVMQVVRQTTQSSGVPECVAALECLLKTG